MDNLTKKSLDFEDFEAKIKLPWRIIETKEEQEFDTWLVGEKKRVKSVKNSQ